MLAEEKAELEKTIREIEQLATDMGLDPFPTHFEIVPPSIMYEFGAYGIPGRFNHWTRGKAYHMMKTQYDYGLNRIYELVINTNPSIAFLLENNRLIDNKFVAAHVLGHTDFFKNNIYFQSTSRNMVDRAALNADRIQKYEFEHGEEEVERFLDRLLSIEQHVNPHPLRRTLFTTRTRSLDPPSERSRNPMKNYEDLFQRADAGQPEPSKTELADEDLRLDLLLFLHERAPKLEDWQRDLIAIVREERLYFQPQIQTKIINEGWATYWHTRILRELPLRDDEFLAFAQLHASVQAPYRGGINPYALGFRIWENIERELAADGDRSVLFEIRAVEDDVSFLRNYLTKELIEDMDLYLFRYEQDEWRVVDRDWERIREALVLERINGGSPVIEIVDDDYGGNRELYLKHSFDGRELDLNDARLTLKNVAKIWGRAVHLETYLGEELKVLHSMPGD